MSTSNTPHYLYTLDSSTYLGGQQHVLGRVWVVGARVALAAVHDVEVLCRLLVDELFLLALRGRRVGFSAPAHSRSLRNVLIHEGRTMVVVACCVCCVCCVCEVAQVGEQSSLGSSSW